MRLCGEWVWCVDMCVWLGVGLCVRVHVLVRKVGETSLDFQSVLLLLLLLLLQMCRNLSRACSNSKAKKCGQGTLLRCKSAMILAEELGSGVNQCTSLYMTLPPSQGRWQNEQQRES